MHSGTAIRRGRLTLAPGRKVGEARLRVPPGLAYDRLLPCLNPDPFPPGSSLELALRARGAGGWGPWLRCGRYGASAQLPASQQGQRAQGLRVAVDLVTSARPRRDPLELRLLLRAGQGAPALRRVWLTRWRRRASPRPGPPLRRAWGRTLRLVQRSQRSAPRAIASRVCSPTSLGMALEFFGRRASTLEVARAVFDRGAKLYGNWAFSAAYAAQRGLWAVATHLTRYAELEAELAAGRPVVLSHKYGPGELQGSPIRATAGHLLVVVGFSAQGDVRVHDPAAPPGSVLRTYRRAELWRAWQERAEGVVYLLRPDPLRAAR